MSDERLPPKLELLLAAEREAAPPDGERDEVAERLAKTLGLATLTAGATVGGAHATHVAATATQASSGGAQVANVAAGGLKAIVAKSVAAKILVAVVVGGASVGAAVGTARVVHRHHQVNATPAVAAPSAATATTTTTTPPPALPPPPNTATQSAQPAASLPTAHSEGHRSRHSDLIAERSLLTDARSAMQSADVSRALTILNEHARRFPHGQLAEERDALEVVALVHVGNQKRARVRAEEFVRRHPNSLFLPSVQQATESATTAH